MYCLLASKLAALSLWFCIVNAQIGLNGHEGGFQDLQGVFADICPDYTQFARLVHDGPLELPFQRPFEDCRKFTSTAVEKVIDDLYPRFIDRDLAHIFQNAFPNTLDTTVMWHVDGERTFAQKSKQLRDKDRWQGAQSFIVTGDINAEWLRDSTNQLAQYQLLAKTAPEISKLILGAINTQAEFVVSSPYCNAFQPPGPSGLVPSYSGQDDDVHPAYEPSVVFECKYELDSLAAFLSLSNQYYESTSNSAFLTDRWFMALERLLQTLNAQAQSTFDEFGNFQGNQYTFSRNTNTGTETLNLRGLGNPLGAGTGLIRSAFRPSDDATNYGFFIPANAMISVELSRTASVLRNVSTTITDAETKTAYTTLASNLDTRSATIRKGIFSHAVVTHPKWGRVFAYEIDGYGSHLLMDDANIPSLLSLPRLGFLPATDEIYRNTRRMILSSEGNPYYLTGPEFSGIGGPHIGLRHAWPMSVLMQAMTSDDPAEITRCLEQVKNVSVFGLINESVDVVRGPGRGGDGMTRSWFAWANSVFAQTVLWVAETRPELLFGEGVGRYIVGEGFEGGLVGKAGGGAASGSRPALGGVNGDDDDKVAGKKSGTTDS